MMISAAPSRDQPADILGYEGGEELAVVTMAALRKLLPGVPADLRYKAWSGTRPQRLHSIRFGLPDS
ncbi:hypothetical protein [Nocardia niigatensis]|uniref:hypothetical protein n=1 Tax=Nocardia niigatensis TaxID=209249 RepID=UPI0002D512AB|nr:hypothetical protein [Nocardia niigatensis]